MKHFREFQVPLCCLIFATGLVSCTKQPSPIRRVQTLGKGIERDKEVQLFNFDGVGGGTVTIVNVAEISGGMERDVTKEFTDWHASAGWQKPFSVPIPHKPATYQWRFMVDVQYRQPLRERLRQMLALLKSNSRNKASTMGVIWNSKMGIFQVVTTEPITTTTIHE